MKKGKRKKEKIVLKRGRTHERKSSRIINFENAAPEFMFAGEKINLKGLGWG